MTVLNMHDYFNQMSSQESDFFFQAVIEGMTPFHLSQVDLYHYFDVDTNEFVILVGAVLSNGYTINHEERIKTFGLTINPRFEYLRVAEGVTKAFRNRATYPLPEKIVLGEN